MKAKTSISHKLNKMKESLVTVFVNKPIYLLVAAFIAFAISSLFIFITNIPIFLQAWSVGGIALFPKVSLNIISTILSVSGELPLVLMLAVSVMGGVNISMIIFKLRATKKIGGSNLAGIGGIFGSALGVGCPACSTSLLSILGVSSGLSVLPFKGAEFTSLGLLVLFISFYFISKSITECEACKVEG